MLIVFYEPTETVGNEQASRRYRSPLHLPVMNLLLVFSQQIDVDWYPFLRFSHCIPLVKLHLLFQSEHRPWLMLNNEIPRKVYSLQFSIFLQHLKEGFPSLRCQPVPTQIYMTNEFVALNELTNERHGLITEWDAL